MLLAIMFGINGLEVMVMVMVETVEAVEVL